jgi:hypothetical protein
VKIYQKIIITTRDKCISLGIKYDKVPPKFVITIEKCNP